jgi:hypothetical protein
MSKKNDARNEEDMFLQLISNLKKKTERFKKIELQIIKYHKITVFHYYRKGIQPVILTKIFI